MNAWHKATSVVKLYRIWEGVVSQQNEFKRGWTVLLGAFIGSGVGLASMVYYSTGIWIRPWQEEFGWTRAEIGFQQSISVVVMMLLAPLVGRLIDRYGLRRVTALCLLGYGLFLAVFPFMSGALLVLYALSFGYAIFGVGTTGIAFTRAVNAFFIKNRGLALGICLTSTGIMAFAMPRFMTPYVAENGWRAGFWVMFAIVMVSVPVVYFLLRDAPEDEDGQPQQAQSGLTFSEAIRTVTFWKVASIFFLISTAILGLIPAFIPLLQDAGLSAKQAGQLGAALGLSVMVARLFIGFIIDRIFAPFVAAVAFSCVALGCLALGLGGIEYAMVAAIALGFAVGAEVDLIGYFTARYFGMAHYGAIYGLQYSIFIFGAAVGPVYTGYIWDVTGNYDLALIIAAALMVPVVIIALTLPRFAND
ncbi:MAG: MFS transporter [Parvibaculales bacterium]